MSGDDIQKLLLAALALATVAFPILRNRGNRRAQIKLDLEIYEQLPDGDAKPLMLQHIEASIGRLLADEHLKRRDPTGIVLGLLLIGVGVAVGAVGIANGGVWWLLMFPASIVALFGAVGFAQDVTLLERDERGRPLSAAKPPDGEAEPDD